jgi:lysophospholipid acyltransferase (LPLAT)-like uncharacterized protein
MKKKRFKNILQILAVKLAWLFVLFWCRIARVRVKNRVHFRQASRNDAPILFLVWHGRMLIPLFAHRNQNIVAMVSEHGDGEIIAQTAQRLGFRTVRGSSTRGGQKAFRDMLKHLKRGEHCTVLPDGPQGPRFVVKMGAIMLAQRSGALILPLTFSAAKPIIFNSWDRFMLWRPFSKVLLMYGAPIQIPRNITPDELEESRLFVERAMQRLQEAADALV